VGKRSGSEVQVFIGSHIYDVGRDSCGRVITMR
jgi:hypothetical protein